MNIIIVIIMIMTMTIIIIIIIIIVVVVVVVVFVLIDVVVSERFRSLCEIMPSTNHTLTRTISKLLRKICRSLSFVSHLVWRQLKKGGPSRISHKNGILSVFLNRVLWLLNSILSPCKFVRSVA